jgi:hypothetical protein
MTPWLCSACTFSNERTTTACEICGTARGKTTTDADDAKSTDDDEEEEEEADAGLTAGGLPPAPKDKALIRQLTAPLVGAPNGFDDDDDLPSNDHLVLVRQFTAPISAKDFDRIRQIHSRCLAFVSSLPSCLCCLSSLSPLAPLHSK